MHKRVANLSSRLQITLKFVDERICLIKYLTKMAVNSPISLLFVVLKSRQEEDIGIYGVAVSPIF